MAWFLLEMFIQVLLLSLPFRRRHLWHHTDTLLLSKSLVSSFSLPKQSVLEAGASDVASPNSSSLPYLMFFAASAIGARAL